jgi:proteasome accessory factor B
MFRLSRFTSHVRKAGRAGSYRVPEGTDLRELARSLRPAPAAGTARLRVRSGAGNALRRRAVAEQAESEGWDRVEVPLAHVDELAEEIVAYGPDVVAIDPGALTEAVVARLERLAGAGSERTT